MDDGRSMRAVKNGLVTLRRSVQGRRTELKTRSMHQVGLLSSEKLNVPVYFPF